MANPMSAGLNGIEAYRTVATASMDPARMIAMGFDGVHEYLVRARSAFESGDRVGRASALDRAFRIIEHLLGALDPDCEAEVVGNLRGLYLFLLDRIGRANVFEEPARLDECEPVLDNLRAAWTQVARDAERSS